MLSGGNELFEVRKANERESVSGEAGLAHPWSSTAFYIPRRAPVSEPHIQTRTIPSTIPSAPPVALRLATDGWGRTAVNATRLDASRARGITWPPFTLGH